MKIGLLGRSGAWHQAEFFRAAAARRIELVPLAFEELAAGVHHEPELDRGEQPIVIPEWLDGLAGILVRAMPRGSLEQIVFRMDVLAEWEQAGIRLINSPKAIEACIDKFLTLARLSRAGLPVPETRVCQTAAQAFQNFQELGGDVVLKPLFGSEGNGLVHLQRPDLAVKLFKIMEEQGQVIYQQTYVHHDHADLRLFVVGDECFGMIRRNDRDWRTNAARGATTAPYSPSDAERDLAWRATRCVGARVCGVDLVYDADAQPFIIEANAVPGWHHLSKNLNVDLADRMLSLFTH